MDGIIKKCDKCGDIAAYTSSYNIHQENNCNGNLIETSLHYDDFWILCNISDDNDFLQAMIDLKEKDIIEYNLKMSQFKTQLEQQKSAREKVKTDNRLKCPTCGSAKVIRIPGLSKATWVALQGVYSIGKISKTFQCMNCGYKW